MERPPFNLHRTRQIAQRIQVDHGRIESLIDQLRSEDGRNELIDEFTIIDPSGKRKNRDVIAVRGDLRLIQERLLRRLFQKSFEPSPHSHGTVPGRNIKSNAMPHAGSRFFYQTDIAGFYPSIHSKRLHLFFRQNGCFGETAGALTTLTSLDNHLALGLITSPILAEAIIRESDIRIAASCCKLGLVYTRYVDDICISAKFDLRKAGIDSSVRKILSQNGFAIQKSKDIFSRIEDSCTVAGVCIRRNRLMAAPDYVNQLHLDLDHAAELALGGSSPAFFYTVEQLRGRVQFVRWLNGGQAAGLLKKFRSINWQRHRNESLQRRLVRVKTKFLRRQMDSQLPSNLMTTPMDSPVSVLR